MYNQNLHGFRDASTVVGTGCCGHPNGIQHTHVQHAEDKRIQRGGGEGRNNEVRDTTNVQDCEASTLVDLL